MNDLIEQLAAINPVPGCERPPIDDVWRKVSGLTTETRRGPRLRSRWLHSPVVRVALLFTVVFVPILAVLAMAIPLHGARHAAPARTGSPSPQPKPTLDPAAQRVVVQALAGRVGSVVVMDPQTGAIEAMATKTTRAGAALQGAPAAQVQYLPEATFDIVTAAAALDRGLYTPASLIAGPSPLVVSGARLRNDGNQSFGPISLTQALSLSVNTVFAKVGATLGRQTLTAYMQRFGFYASPHLTAASGPLPPSGVRLGQTLTLPTSRRVDLGRLGAGQSSLVATPLQMAMVAAAVADGGKLMAPHTQKTAPRLVAQVMKPSTARAVTQMMTHVVTHGTGTSAAISGVSVAGKTGTAHLTGSGAQATDAWFIGFAPANHPTIAIAVALHGVRSGYGGTEAAPLAARVIRALLP